MLFSQEKKKKLKNTFIKTYLNYYKIYLCVCVFVCWYNLQKMTSNTFQD